MNKLYNICLLGLFLSSLVYALPSDKKEVIHFSAGEIEWDQSNYHGIFKNSVSFIQGTSKIFATRGYSDGNKKQQFTKVVLFGDDATQAHFITTPKENDLEVDAKADKMIYLPLEKLIKLKGNVQIVQGRYHFQAPYLEYHMDTQKVITKSLDNHLTTIIVDPENT